MEWKPNKLIASILGLLTQPIAMFYLNRPGLAVIYFLVPLLIVSAEFFLAAPWYRFASVSSLIAVVCAVHAYRIASRTEAMTSRSWYSRWYGLLGIMLVYGGLVFMLRAFVVEPFRMPSASMYPTIAIGDHLIAGKYGYGNYGSYGLAVADGEMSANIERGDVIVFKYPPDPSITFVKRVIGMPGDTLIYREQQLIINGLPVATSAVTVGEYPSSYRDVDYSYLRESHANTEYVVAYSHSRAGMPFETTVPENSYFVLGDNRDNSKDSRYWGFVEEKAIIGKVIYVTGK